MNKLPKALAKKRDDAAEKFAIKWSKPSPETAELEAISHAHKQGYAQCFRDMIESEELKGLVSALNLVAKGFDENGIYISARKTEYISTKALTKWQQFIGEVEGVE